MSRGAVVAYYATITTIIAGIIALTLYAGLTRNSSRDWFPDDRQRVMGTEYGGTEMTGAAGSGEGLSSKIVLPPLTGAA